MSQVGRSGFTAVWPWRSSLSWGASVSWKIVTVAVLSAWTNELRLSKYLAC